MARRDDDRAVAAVTGDHDGAGIRGTRGVDAAQDDHPGVAVRVAMANSTPQAFGGRFETPFRFGAKLLVAAGVPTVALFVVPDQVFAPIGLVAVLLVVVGGAASAGAAAAAVLRSASQHPTPVPTRGADLYLLLSGLLFVVLCVVAPGAILIAAHAWYDFNGLEPRSLLLTAVAGAGLLLGAVFAVTGAVLLTTPGGVMHLAWAKIDLAAQVFALTSVLATIAILY